MFPDKRYSGTMNNPVNLHIKGNLIGHFTSMGKARPVFEVETLSSLPTPRFLARIWVEQELLAEAEGSTKKEAERIACEKAFALLNELDDHDSDVFSSSFSEVAFSGAATTPVPIYTALLTQSVEVALEYAKENDTPDDVCRRAARFYRQLLAELGH